MKKRCNFSAKTLIASVWLKLNLANFINLLNYFFFYFSAKKVEENYSGLKKILSY